MEAKSSRNGFGYDCAILMRKAIRGCFGGVLRGGQDTIALRRAGHDYIAEAGLDYIMVATGF